MKGILGDSLGWHLKDPYRAFKEFGANSNKQTFMILILQGTGDNIIC